MIISDALAELWPGEDTLGRVIQFVDVLDGKRSLENPPIWVVGIMPPVTSSFSKRGHRRVSTYRCPQLNAVR